MLIVSLSILPKKQNGVITFPPVDPKSEMRLLERLSRVFLANFAGTQLQNSNPITFIGQSMPTLSRSGKPRIAKLATLAAHANFSPEYDAELGLYRFQWRGKSVVVPLASDQVKVNGVWKKLGEFVLQKNKETYIDPVGLDAAVGN